MKPCPHCGAEDSLEVLVDAWTIYEFKGFDNIGAINQDFRERVRVDEFDDAHVQCQQCGEHVSSYEYEKEEQS